ncbi:hypothetical protein [Roseibium sp. RKSG952]|uniref:hypothetical protein n=1 Tax=Roseibium sp. RKSG952 TaxID=2529384 RepID=UPI0012BB8FB1|nr:hypothetical protein [Roseibium sp. RKSG952]MTH98092.1 hypothetical protein [Roseibium sp. RKSG952]
MAHRILRVLACGTLLALSACQTKLEAPTASYEELKAAGYKTSKLTSRDFKGWYLTGPNDRYFCVGAFNMVEFAPNKIGVPLQSGKYGEINLEDIKRYRGVDDLVPPKLWELRAGRPRFQDVGVCQRVDS